MLISEDPEGRARPKPEDSGADSGAGAGAEDSGGAAPDPSRRPETRAFDAALVVVHGMGNAYTSQILLEWAEPLLERMDWIARDRIIGGTPEHGVRINDSQLTGEFPMVTATVAFPKAGTGVVGESGIVVGAETVERRIAIIEARWSESFVPMTRSQVFRWAVPFMWRAITRTLSLFSLTMVALPWLMLTQHLRPSSDDPLIGRMLTAVVDVVRVVLGALVYTATWLGLVALGVILTPILPLLSPLLLIPWFKDLAQGVLDGIVESIGDVAAWKERPVRASAMRLVVRDALARAKQLVGTDGDVHLFAHSQGAAVSTFALFEELDPASFNVRRLTTVGAAVVLLGREHWRGRSDVYAPVANWLRASTAEHPVEWANFWAVWDPFSAGPIADTPTGAHERWRASYFPRPGDDTLGPAEHAVHNTSQPFLDHGEYHRNIVQVVDPTARRLLGDELPERPAEVVYLENRLAVIDKKSLGTNMIAAVVIAAILPGLPLVSEFFAWLIASAARLGAAVVDFFGAAVADPLAPVAWLLDDGRLSTWGWVIAGALVAALLLWLNQLLNGMTQRSLIWERCPLEVRQWLVLTSLPRLLYVLGSAVTVWLAILSWPQPQPDASWLVFWAIALAVVAGFVIAEPRFAPVPGVVPARTGAPAPKAAAVASAVSPEPPLTIGRAISSEVYQRELAARRSLLAPTTPWSRFIARRLHGWSPKP